MANYIRINQIDYAVSMQQRTEKLENFSRMFYPLKFDKPNNNGSRMLFSEKRHCAPPFNCLQNMARGYKSEAVYNINCLIGVSDCLPHLSFLQSTYNPLFTNSGYFYSEASIDKNFTRILGLSTVERKGICAPPFNCLQNMARGYKSEAVYNINCLIGASDCLPHQSFLQNTYNPLFTNPGYFFSEASINKNCTRILGLSTVQRKGIYGFNECVGEQIPNCTQNCNKSDSGPSDIFLGYLLLINLQFAQQHVVRQDQPDNHDWHWGNEDTLYFNTEDSAGITEHSISINKPDLWSAMEQGVSQNSDMYRIIILFVLTILVWYLILIYFSRRVFGIFIPEPIPEHILLTKGHIKTSKNPYKILIRGKDDEFKTQPYDSAGNKVADRAIKYLDVLEYDFNIKPDTIKNKIFIVDNLDAAMVDVVQRKQALAYLEALVEVPTERRICIFIRCKIAPLYRLTNPQAYPFVARPKISVPYTEMDEVYRWSKLLARFEKRYFPVKNELKCYDKKNLSEHQIELLDFVKAECKIWPELHTIGNELVDIILDGEKEQYSEDQILEYIRTHAHVYYRNYWELCTRDERLALYQLATGKLMNPENQDIIEHLYRRGYINREPYFRVANLTFKRYILTAELLEDVQDWEQAATENVWESIKIPLFIMLFCLTGLLFYIASDSTLGLLSGLVAFIPLLLKGVNTVKVVNSPGLEPDQEA